MSSFFSTFKWCTSHKKTNKQTGLYFSLEQSIGMLIRHCGLMAIVLSSKKNPNFPYKEPPSLKNMANEQVVMGRQTKKT